MDEIDASAATRMARAIERAVSRFTALASRAMAVGLGAIEEVIAPYPPQPSRTRGKGFNTYVRGIGKFPRSAFTADSNAAGGFKVNRRKAKGKIKFTSQQMDKRFKTTVTATENEVIGNLHNSATYSGYVLGSKDQGAPVHQMPYHMQTGWENRDDALEKAMPTIEGALNGAIDGFIANIKGR